MRAFGRARSLKVCITSDSRQRVRDARVKGDKSSWTLVIIKGAVERKRKILLPRVDFHQRDVDKY